MARIEVASQRYGPWTRIDGRLYIGSEEAAHDESFLRAHAVRSILSLVPTWKRTPAGCMHRTAYLMDDRGNALERLVDAVRTLWELKRDPENAPVLVHCKSGASRSPLVGAFVLAFERHTDLASELRRIGAMRVISPSEGLRDDLIAFRTEIEAALAPRPSGDDERGEGK